MFATSSITHFFTLISYTPSFPLKPLLSLPLSNFPPLIPRHPHQVPADKAFSNCCQPQFKSGRTCEASLPVRLPPVQQDVHKELSPQGSQKGSHGREAIPVSLGGVRLGISPLRRADTALPETHGGETVQMCSVRQEFLSLRSPQSSRFQALVGISTEQSARREKRQ